MINIFGCCVLGLTGVIVLAHVLAFKDESINWAKITGSALIGFAAALWRHL